LRAASRITHQSSNPAHQNRDRTHNDHQPQALFVLALMPFITALRGLPLQALPSVLKEGAQVLAQEPAFPAAYIAVNIAFNIAALALVRSTSAVVVSLTMACLTPLAVLAFTLPLPLLQAAQLGGTFWAGCGVVLAGLYAYNHKGTSAAEKAA